MTLLQLGIGTVNDVVDAPADAGVKPGKPIPAGIVAAGAARSLALGCFAAGLALAWSVAPLVGTLALVVVAIGLVYDLRLKGTAWSWLPFAAGIPLLPVFGWLGATGGLPSWFLVLVPAAVEAGAALAIGNSIVDVDRDRAAGRTSVAAALGRRTAGRLAMGLLVVVWVLDGGSLIGGGASLGPALVSVAAVAAALASARIAAKRPGLAERAWQLEAVSLGVAAIAWTIAIAT